MFDIHLNRREKRLLFVLIAMFVLMYLSNKPDWIGVTMVLVAAWTAFLLFFVMIGVFIFTDPYK